MKYVIILLLMFSSCAEPKPHLPGASGFSDSGELPSYYSPELKEALKKEPFVAADLNLLNQEQIEKLYTCDRLFHLTDNYYLVPQRWFEQEIEPLKRP